MQSKFLESEAGLGVEFEGLDLGSPFNQEEIQVIRNLWLQRGIAVFPNQKLTHENLENFTLLFGNFGDDPYLSSLKDRPNIVEVKRSAKEKATPFGGSWHSDWSFQVTPPSATFLHSKIIRYMP